MRSNIITGLVALQLFAGLTAQAQNYYIKIQGDQNTRVADHISWEEGSIPVNLDESQEAYNLIMADGKKVVGTMLFQSAAGTMSYATHYLLNSATEQVVARKLLKHYNSNYFVIGEKIKEGAVVSTAVLYYDRATGDLIKAWDLFTLPVGYKLLHVFDVTTELSTPDQMRILCTVSVGNDEGVMELLFDMNTGQYKVIHYKPATIALSKYNSVYYVDGHHYGHWWLGDKTSFYGMGITRDEKSVAFCYSDNVFEQYNLTSARGVDEIAGVQMNGSFGPDGTRHQIDMAFLDSEGDICVQQKDNMTTLNWRKSYHFIGGKLRMSMGRDGHGTKGNNGLNYFVTVAHHNDFGDPEGRITTLHYDPLSGAMKRPNVWYMSGIGINKAGGFPNNIYDPPYNYTFIADRFNQEHGFKFGTGNTLDNSVMSCIKLYKLQEVRSTLRESRTELNTSTKGPFTARSLNMVKVNDIRVDVFRECLTEQRGLAQDNAQSQLTAAGTLMMDAEHLQVAHTGKTIASLRLLSIDGRLVADIPKVNSNNFRQEFTQRLVPGIYIVHISYSDHSTEARKVSIH
jgi:hypothetical protein